MYYNPLEKLRVRPFLFINAGKLNRIIKLIEQLEEQKHIALAPHFTNPQDNIAAAHELFSYLDYVRSQSITSELFQQPIILLSIIEKISNFCITISDVQPEAKVRLMNSYLVLKMEFEKLFLELDS